MPIKHSLRRTVLSLVTLTASLMAVAPACAQLFSPSLEAARLMRFTQLHGLNEGPGPIKLRHPVVLAHGAVWGGALGLDRVFGESDYWKGITEHLWEQGVPTIAPVVSPAGSIRERAQTLKDAINSAFPKGKVHIVAHSMGGLDSRYMISMLGMSHRVATLTTVSTPHHGSWYADFADRFILKGQGLDWLARKAKINYQALQNLSVSYLEKYFNPVVTNVPGVEYYSYAGVTKMLDLSVHEWGAKLVVKVSERIAARKTIGMTTRMALTNSIPGALDNIQAMMADGEHARSWIDPEIAGRSDGVVSVSSARWGTYLGEIRAAHLHQIGTNPRKVDHIFMWDRVLRNLVALGG